MTCHNVFDALCLFSVNSNGLRWWFFIFCFADKHPGVASFLCRFGRGRRRNIY